MMKLTSMIAAIALGGCFATVGEDGQMVGGEAAFTLNLPAAPPLVTIQPGVSVVRDWDGEVFYSNGYYWTRNDRYWYRTNDHRGRWSRVEHRSVPVAIAQSPPGRYRHYRGEEVRHGEREHEHQHDGREGPVDRR
ncbi:MAG: hypothetical protein HZB56_08260 [Deltaproteobacteria bacterium]|nr:hypothetical protein [Deltaproteobacteria bacterium]